MGTLFAQQRMEHWNYYISMHGHHVQVGSTDTLSAFRWDQEHS